MFFPMRSRLSGYARKVLNKNFVFAVKLVLKLHIDESFVMLGSIRLSFNSKFFLLIMFFMLKVLCSFL